MRPKARLLFAELALEADRAREPGGDQQPEDALPHLELRADGRRYASAASRCAAASCAIPPAARSSSESRRSRENGSRSAVA